MKVLVIGFSKIFQTRVLPAFELLPCITAVEVATLTRGNDIKLAGKLTKFYSSYEEALATSSAGMVYITTVNSKHAIWAKRALEMGFHVAVDKPAFLSRNDATEILSLARLKRLCVSEAVVYPFHPQFQIVKNEFKIQEDEPRHVAVNFSMPGFDKGNFRYDPSQGGGAVFDLASYAMTIGRVIFEDVVSSVEVVRNFTSSDFGVVDNAFSLLVRYEHGQTVTGHFGFDTEYVNHILILGKFVSVSFDRVFTIPPEMRNTLAFKCRNKSYNIEAPEGNTFANFFDAVISDLESGVGDFSRWLSSIEELQLNLEKLMSKKTTN